jgi:NAD(P)H-dependent flavin oxidoreductase YrpB (nitropropane dioxygenase family)
MAGYTSPELVAAVSNAGGLGVHGALSRDPDELRGIIRTTRERAGRQPFGVQHVVQWLDEAAFDACLEEQVPVFCFSWGDPGKFARQAHDVGAKVICQVTRLDEVAPALGSGADVLIAQGTEAGGHSGLIPLLGLLPAVVAAAGDVPVLAAGGIVDGRGLAAALALGAVGGWLGTRFLATPEAWISPAWKKALLDASPGDTVHTLAFDVLWMGPWPGARVRAIRNAFTDAWTGHEEDLAQRLTDVQQRVWQAEKDDDPQFIALMAGVGTGGIHAIRPAGDLVREIVAEAEAVIAGLTGLVG